MPRKPPRSTEERLVRAQKSMMPGTLGGRVASATPMSLDVTRLDPRLRASPASAVGGGGFDPNEDPVVIGLSAFAGDTYGVAIGHGAQTRARYGVAIGHGAETDNQGVAIGEGAWARDDGAISIGAGDALGNTDICIGNGATGTTTDGSNGSNIAIGGNAVTGAGGAAVANAIAIGQYAEADADSSIALGNSAYASHLASTAIGASAVTTANHQIMLGTANDFVEIPGNGTANGLVLTDTSSGTRYLVQITSGALVLGTAP